MLASPNNSLTTGENDKLAATAEPSELARLLKSRSPKDNALDLSLQSSDDDDPDHSISSMTKRSKDRERAQDLSNSVCSTTSVTKASGVPLTKRQQKVKTARTTRSFEEQWKMLSPDDQLAVAISMYHECRRGKGQRENSRSVETNPLSGSLIVGRQNKEESTPMSNHILMPSSLPVPAAASPKSQQLPTTGPSPTSEPLVTFQDTTAYDGLQQFDFDSLMSHTLARNPVKKATVGQGNEYDTYEVINQYTIIDEIGRGAHGFVMLAVNSETQDPFAIKAVRKPAKKTKFGKQLPTVDIEREIRIMKNLRHKNIVRLHEVIDDEDEQMLYLVMDYMPNGPILDMTPSGQIASKIDDGELLIKCAIQIAEGLSYCHKRKVIHCDIKPDNILVQNDDEVCIADFGTSLMVEIDEEQGIPSPTRANNGAEQDVDRNRNSNSENSSAPSTEPSFVSRIGANGTPAFFSPESCRGEEPTSASDVWSFGVTLFAMKFGQLPFPGSTVREVVDKILHEDIKFPLQCSPQWKDLLSKMMEKDASKRMTLKQFVQHPIIRGSSELARSGSLLEESDTASIDIDEMEPSFATRGPQRMSIVARKFSDDVRSNLEHKLGMSQRSLSIGNGSSMNEAAYFQPPPAPHRTSTCGPRTMLSPKNAQTSPISQSQGSSGTRRLTLQHLQKHTGPNQKKKASLLFSNE